MEPKDTEYWIAQIERVNRGELSLDALYRYEGYPDTPEHAELLRKCLKSMTS
jgi:hypothetical protein